MPQIASIFARPCLSCLPCWTRCALSPKVVITAFSLWAHCVLLHQAAAALAPDCYAALCRTAELLLSLGRTGDAAVAFRKARALFPPTTTGAYHRTVQQLSDTSASVTRDLPALESHCPRPSLDELATCWNNGGVALLMTGDPHGGVALLTDSLLTSPHHQHARKVGRQCQQACGRRSLLLC